MPVRKWMLTRRVLGQAGAATALAAVVGRPARADRPYRIGALNPITGAGSTYGSGMQKTILFALEEVKRAGGVDGRPIEVYAEDTQTSPDAAVLAARKLIDANKVDAIIGTWSSSVSLAVLPITNEANCLLLHTSSAPALSTPAQNPKHLAWRFQAASHQIGDAYAAIAAHEKASRAAAMAFNNDVQIASVGFFRSAWEKAGGKLPNPVVYEPNRTSYAAELQQALSEKPDFLVVSGYVPDTSIILREAYEAGNTAKIVIPGWAMGPATVKALGAEVLEGLIVVDAVPDAGSAAFKTFDAAYRAATGNPGSSNIYAAMCYDMVAVLTLAMQKAGPSADNAAIAQVIPEVANPPGQAVSSFAEGRKLLQAGQKINYEGASGPIDFDERGDVTPVFGVSVFHDGKLEQRYLLK
ncbi:MAG: ABC transporter substrate-binding protein [Acidisphaera sp.]|nr:ABC transporter substrate-binding protein [Acidisphaera sp.]